MKPIILLVCLSAVAAEPPVYIDLSGPWRIADGDQSQYASPPFDDRDWSIVNLPVPRGLSRTQSQAVDPMRDSPEAFFWLRRWVELPPHAANAKLALTVGAIREGYQVFVNGVLVGATGPLEIAKLQIARPRVFDLPPLGAPARVLIALRVWDVRLAGTSAWLVPDRGPWLLTSSSAAPRSVGEAAIDRQRLVRMGDFGYPLVALCLAVVLFLIWLNARSQRELLWLGLFLVANAVGRIIRFGALGMDATPFSTMALALTICGRFLPGALLAQFAASSFRIRWLPWPIWILTFLNVADLAVESSAQYRWGLFGIALLTLAALFHAWQGEGADGAWPHTGRKFVILGIALTMFTQGVSSGTWVVIGGPSPNFFRDTVNLGTAPDVYVPPFLAFLITLVLVRRLLRDRDERVKMSNEFEAARTVQQLLLPAAATRTSAYAADAVYEPALQVGGDFYFTRAEPDGALILVVGDVSGKGLRAALLVSVAIGILRNEKSTSPNAILVALNEGVTGHTGGGFVTCCCARFDPDGSTTIANAGHPSPYCDGREVAMEAGLPLGIVAGVGYGEVVVHGDHFTLISDGVVEAENPQRELFGFDRTRDISGQSAQQIAKAAQNWGQNDDITVVTVRRQT